MLLIIDSKGGFAAEVAPYAEELQAIFARTPDRVTPNLPYYSEIENIIVPHTNMVDTLVAQGVDKTIIPMNYRQSTVADVRIALSGRPKFGAYIEDPLNPLTTSNKEQGKSAQEKKPQEQTPKEVKSESREERKPRQDRNDRKQERRDNNRDRKNDERGNRKQDRKQNGDRTSRQERNDRKQERRDNREVKVAEPTKPVLNTVPVDEQPKEDKAKSFEISSKAETVFEAKPDPQEVKPKTRIVESILEFHEERVPDKRLGVGREKLEQKGRNGFIKQEVDENGNVIRVIAHELPRDQIIRYSARKPEDSEVTSESAEPQTIESETPSEETTFTSAPEVPSFINANAEPEVPNFVTDTVAASNKAPVNFISEEPTFNEAPNFMSAEQEAAPVPNFITDGPKPTPGGFTPEELGITPEPDNPGFKADGGGITLNFIEP